MQLMSHALCTSALRSGRFYSEERVPGTSRVGGSMKSKVGLEAAAKSRFSESGTQKLMVIVIFPVLNTNKVLKEAEAEYSTESVRYM